MVGVVVEKYNTSVCDLACNPSANTFCVGAVLPIKTVNIIYKSKVLFTKSLKFSLLRILSEYVIITNGIRWTYIKVGG